MNYDGLFKFKVVRPTNNKMYFTDENNKNFYVTMTWKMKQSIDKL